MTMSAPRRLADFRTCGAAALAGLFLLVAGGAAADPPLRHSAEILSLERGLFCATGNGGRFDAPDTEFGWIHVPDEPVEMQRPGPIVPAVIGLGFGVTYTFDGTDPILIRYVVDHPPMPPSGRTRQSWESWVIGGVTEIVFFQFDLEEELLPGRWSFSGLDGANEVFHAAFDVVPPAAAPHLVGLCAGEELLTLNR
jgi:hypothetical protein